MSNWREELNGGVARRILTIPVAEEAVRRLADVMYSTAEMLEDGDFAEAAMRLDNLSRAIPATLEALKLAIQLEMQDRPHIIDAIKKEAFNEFGTR